MTDELPQVVPDTEAALPEQALSESTARTRLECAVDANRSRTVRY